MAGKKKSITARSKKLNISVQSKALPYDSDFYSWTKIQSNLLEKGKLGDLDLKNLAEEIKSLGKSDKRALKNHLINLLLHLLKSKHQPAMRKNSNSWDASIRNAQREIELILEDSPSLRRELPKMIQHAFEKACEYTIEETGLPQSILPSDCPWSIEEVLENPLGKKRKKTSVPHR